MTTPPHPINHLLNKVPEVTLGFWLIKILSTTVGETGADYLAVQAGLGQACTSSAMAALLAVALFFQMRSPRYVPWLYWLTVVLVSVVGTQITDLLTDRMGVSLYASTGAFAVALAGIFGAWWRSERTLDIQSIDDRRRAVDHHPCFSTVHPLNPQRSWTNTPTLSLAPCAVPFSHWPH